MSSWDLGGKKKYSFKKRKEKNVKSSMGVKRERHNTYICVSVYNWN